jgi:arylsulfatase A-like enzyme
MAAKSATRRSGKKKPNILIFMMDTQGSRNMSCYGYRKPTTPNIDQIAREGVLFENHFVTSPWTLPVHASLFTGRYESGHGAGAQHEGLEPGLPQMGELFTRNGYRSVSFCNNHWAYDSGLWSAGTGFQEHIRYGEARHKAVPPYVPSGKPEERDKGSLKAVGLALNWIDKKVAGKNKPFLMFINCLEPHDPYLPPEPFRSRFMEPGVSYDKAVAGRGGQAVSTIGDRCQTLDEWMIERSLYDGSTACLDDRIGKLVEGLKERGVYDETIFIVTGDHGDVQGEQIGYAYHSQNGVWDGACKTPLVIRHPKTFKAGTRCKQLVQITDALPALMQIAGVKSKEMSASIQGENLLDALKGPTREFALIEAMRAMHPMRRGWTEAEDRENLDVRFMNVWYKAARAKRYKYVWVSNGQDMLFDVVKDPDERWNIIQSKPEIARKLRKALEAKLMTMEQRYYPDMFKPTNTSSHSPEVLRRLAAWGLYQPGTVAPWDPSAQAKWEKDQSKRKR